VRLRSRLSSHHKPKKPTEEEALRFLKKMGCKEKIIQHCKVVSKTALEMAESILESGTIIDLELVRLGGLLHDVGRSVTSDVNHGVEGARLLREEGFPENLAKIAERHVGAGIPRKEAKVLGLPVKDFMPQTLEEKIVCYADKLVSGKKLTNIEYVINEFATKLGPDHPSITRIKNLHTEIMSITNR
jgi:uncharacterized protein